MRSTQLARGAMLASLVAILLVGVVFADSKCPWVFEAYEPSELEREWEAAIQQLQNHAPGASSQICTRTTADKANVDEWIKMVSHFEAQERPLPGIHSAVHKVLSRFRFRRCDGHERTTWIEPLAGPLRHPYFCLYGQDYLVNKGYMIVGDLAHSMLRDGGRSARARYFDAGASLYTEGAGGSSQQWIVDTFRALNISFADISAWEATPSSAEVVFSQIPAAVKPVYHWFNIPVSAQVGHSDNPYTHIKALSRPEDFVVFKLDIDTPHIEKPLSRQLLEDEQLLRLVDEFFFEYHVDMPEMYPYWGSGLPDRPSDAFSLFRQLRSKGIRAHAWV